MQNDWSKPKAKNNYGNQFLVSIDPYLHTHHAYIMYVLAGARNNAVIDLNTWRKWYEALLRESQGQNQPKFMKICPFSRIPDGAIAPSPLSLRGDIAPE